MARRTIRCKMIATRSIDEALNKTAIAFADACNQILAKAQELKTSNKIKLHHEAYRQTKYVTGLTANLVARAIARVCGAIKTAAKKKRMVKFFKPSSINYDARIFEYRERDETVSISAIDGRMHIPLVIGEYQRLALKGKKPTFATVLLSGKTWYINIVVYEERLDSKSDPGSCLGVDLGLNNIAVTSSGKFFDGTDVQTYKAKRARVRASLQSKRSAGAKKVLHRLSGKESRHIRNVNHVASKQIVDEADKGGYGMIRLEKLTNIRTRTKTFSKHLNRMVGGWSFGQLQTFIGYKADQKGIEVEFVDPAFTSQTCCICFSRGVRTGRSFVCSTCGETDADLNAAKVIAAGGVPVNAPKIAGIKPSYKLTALAVGG